jgi:hypothetical protein
LPFTRDRVTVNPVETPELTFSAGAQFKDPDGNVWEIHAPVKAE